MNTIKKIPTARGRKFSDTPYLKIRRIRTETRRQIRHLLKSFLPLSEVQKPADKSNN